MFAHPERIVKYVVQRIEQYVQNAKKEKHLNLVLIYVLNVLMDVPHQLDLPFVPYVAPDVCKLAKTLIILLVTNAKVEKLHRQEIRNVEIARQVFTRLK